MRVLALDTTTRAGSVALVEDGRVLEEHAGDPVRTHAERLPLEIHALLDLRGIRSDDIDLFAVASGPGSFTGLRIGIATMQGFAFVHRRKMAPISALDALAHLASDGAGEGLIVAAWMDAHRRDVFTALYRVASAPLFDSRRVIEIEGPQVGPPGAILDRWARLIRGQPLSFIGDAAVQWADAIREHHPDARIVEHPLLAGTIGRLALAQAAAGLTIDPSSVRPLYVRRPDAEIAREARAAEPLKTPGTQR